MNKGLVAGGLAVALTIGGFAGHLALASGNDTDHVFYACVKDGIGESRLGRRRQRADVPWWRGVGELEQHRTGRIGRTRRIRQARRARPDRKDRPDRRGRKGRRARPGRREPTDPEGRRAQPARDRTAGTGRTGGGNGRNGRDRRDRAGWFRREDRCRIGDRRRRPQQWSRCHRREVGHRLLPAAVPGRYVDVVPGRRRHAVRQHRVFPGRPSRLDRRSQ